MKNSSKMLLALLILFVAVTMFFMASVSASISSSSQTYTTTNDNILIESKFKKVSTYKITFNGNGGKIGSKNSVVTNIQKGNKIKKFPATPKRTGHTFKGWYTKKSGGTKVSVNTKPTKSIFLYAQWKKSSSTTSSSSKIVGRWEGSKRDKYYDLWVTVQTQYIFYKDGRFQYYEKYPSYAIKFEGKYLVSKGKVHFKERKHYDSDFSGTLPSKVDVRKLKYKSISKRGDLISSYKIGTDKNSAYLSISNQDNWALDNSALEQGKAWEYTFKSLK